MNQGFYVGEMKITDLLQRLEDGEEIRFLNDGKRITVQLRIWCYDQGHQKLRYFAAEKDLSAWDGEPMLYIAIEEIFTTARAGVIQ